MYKSVLNVRDTQKAIKAVKIIFEEELTKKLSLERVSAPLFVESGSGINDDLNGVERKVEFDIKMTGTNGEIVQSLAKWKRLALYKYGFNIGEGCYTNMNAIRRDDMMDNIHSIFVDQWDWEKVISKEQRTLDYLKSVVVDIVNAIVETHESVKRIFPSLTRKLTREVFFITSQELYDMYPNLSGKEREHLICKEHNTCFIMQIGGVLRDGNVHDGRAPDYDDWSLNGDLLFWNETMQQSIEISSMGIRVDAVSLKNQLQSAKALDRLVYEYHKGIVDGKLPLTIGGGIGQSRLCMLLLEKLHIGEVQASIWTKQVYDYCKENDIELL